MSYKNAFILASEDSKADIAAIPPERNGKPTAAYIEYDLIINNPYKFTQDDVQFNTFLIKNGLETYEADPLRSEFFAKPRACFRASPLVKKYGWGIHYNDEGKVAIYGAESEEYSRLATMDGIKLLKGMRSKRK